MERLEEARKSEEMKAKGYSEHHVSEVEEEDQ